MVERARLRGTRATLCEKCQRHVLRHLGTLGGLGRSSRHGALMVRSQSQPPVSRSTGSVDLGGKYPGPCLSLEGNSALPMGELTAILISQSRSAPELGYWAPVIRRASHVVPGDFSHTFPPFPLCRQSSLTAIDRNLGCMCVSQRHARLSSFHALANSGVCVLQAVLAQSPLSNQTEGHPA